MSVTTEVFDPTAEMDLSGEGLQRQRAIFEITDAEVRPAKSGLGQVLRLEYTALEPVDEQEGFTVEEYLTIEHTNPKTQKIGRGQLKRRFQIAFGQPQGSIPALVGARVSGEVYEDDEGFRRIGRLREVEGDVGAGTEPATTVSL